MSEHQYSEESGRIRAALHVLQGRPTIYRAKLWSNAFSLQANPDLLMVEAEVGQRPVGIRLAGVDSGDVVVRGNSVSDAVGPEG